MVNLKNAGEDAAEVFGTKRKKKGKKIESL